RVRVHQHDAIALVLERPDGLGARVIEFAGLADHDRPGADDEDGVDVAALRHGRRYPQRTPPPLRGRSATRQRCREGGWTSNASRMARTTPSVLASTSLSQK